MGKGCQATAGRKLEASNVHGKRQATTGLSGDVMSRTGSALSRRDRSRTGWSITHSGSKAGGAPTASALNPSVCRSARHSWSGGEAAGDGCVGAGWTGAGGGDGTEPWLRGRGGGSGAAPVASGTSTVIRRTTAAHTDQREAILDAC